LVEKTYFRPSWIKLYVFLMAATRVLLREQDRISSGGLQNAGGGLQDLRIFRSLLGMERGPPGRGAAGLDVVYDGLEAGALGGVFGLV
jgi:hypothetical protein